MRRKKEITSEKKQYIEMVLSDANTVLEIRKKKSLSVIIEQSRKNYKHWQDKKKGENTSFKNVTKEKNI